MANRLVVRILGAILLSACSPQEESTRTEVQAFIVVGAGNGVAMSGREIVFLGESFPSKLIPLRDEYERKKAALVEDALSQDPASEKVLDGLKAAVLDDETSLAITLAIVSNAVAIRRTDLGGSADIPAGAKYVFFRAKMSDENYTWLVEIEGAQPKFILSNHNVTKVTDALGAWVFEKFAEEMAASLSPKS